MTDAERSRQGFEHWAITRYMNVRRVDSGYVDPWTERCWQAWTAAKQHKD